MKKGFMDLAAVSLIPAYPGQTAEWYAEEALDSGCISSDAKDPVRSLANTLAKQVRDKREPRVRRERRGGVYVYFPVSETSPSDPGEDIVVQISLSTKEMEEVDNLVAVDSFSNRNEAIKWLVVEAIKAKRSYLDRVADTRKQIDRLKRDVAAM